MSRDYTGLKHALAPTSEGGGGVSVRQAAMKRFVDAAWPALSAQGVSWIGFYTIDAGQASMSLAACRNKPACSPIGMHGVCGRGWLARRAIVVNDVAVLGKNYVACDPKDRSELVIPLFERGACWGVLDADSFDVGAFDATDADRLQAMLESMGLTEPGRFAGETIVL